MRQPLLAAVAIALVASPLHAQPAVSAALPAAATAASTAAGVIPSLDRAFGLLDQREFTAAHRAFSALLSQTDLSPAERATTLRGLGAALFELSRRAQADEVLARALEAATTLGDRRDQGWARRYLGALRYGDGHADQAQALWTAAREDFVACGDVRGEFEVIDDMSLLVQGLKKRPLVERGYAIAVAERDPLLEGRMRRRWGQALLDAALPGPALIELERAVALIRPLAPHTRGYLTDALAVLGWALRAHGANDRAVPVHREAIGLARAAGDRNSVMWNYHGLGIALAELARYQEADLAMRRALDLARTLGSATDIRLIAEAAGWVALRRGDWRQAASILESTITLPGIELTATPVVHLARAYRGLHRLDDALAMANRGVELSRKLGLVDNELRGLIEVAQSQDAKGDLDGAQQTVGGVIDRLEGYRAELAPVDFLKQGFGDRFADAYGVGVRLQMRRGRVADALTAAERLRSRAFADLLARHRVREADQAETESGDWSLGSGEIEPPSSSAPADSPRMIAAMDSAALGALASRLPTTIVVYWIHERGSYAWVVQPGGAIHAVTLHVTPGEVQRAVRRASDDVPDVSIGSPSGAVTSMVVNSRAAYRGLHVMLWAPLEQWLPREPDARITIVPHGPLFALPFGALLDRHGHYVVERYALHYAASGAVLTEAMAHQRPSLAGARELVVADPQPLPNLMPGVRLPPLAGARAEARAIASLFASNADLLVGSRATEPAVRAGLGGARVVHFATHAIVSDSDPLGSHLMLSTGGAGNGAAERDGRLTASEVAGLSLSADLVVLGACRSARGPVSSDGIAGLTRAFMTAGAPSVVATLWDVSDQTTARVMTRFYAGYLTGMSKDRALRAAQLALLGDLRAGKVRRKAGETSLTYAEHPHLWAGTILIGAP